MRIAVVGCGLIGTRRAAVARAAGDDVVVVADLDRERAIAVADSVDAEVSGSWEDAVVRDDVDAVVVSTVNNSLRPVSVHALEHGKHVLCEKPFGRTVAEAREMLRARRNGTILKVGFNHRHHPALRRAHELAEAGAIGRLFAVRAAYGHGGRAGYEREWRGDAALAGGGELLDQGVHVVDLCRWFLGDFAEAVAMTSTAVWPVEPLEDNAFALLRTVDGRVASFHTSWTQWRNLFRFEIFGEDGYLAVEGLGGSYGPERLTHGRRRPESGPPDEESWTFDGPDESWADEWSEFRAAVAEGRQPLGSAEDGYAAACVVEALYESSATGRFVPIGGAA